MISHLHPVKTPILGLDGYVPRARNVEARALDLLGLGRVFEGLDDGLEFVGARLGDFACQLPEREATATATLLCRVSLFGLGRDKVR